MAKKNVIYEGYSDFQNSSTHSASSVIYSFIPMPVFMINSGNSRSLESMEPEFTFCVLVLN